MSSASNVVFNYGTVLGVVPHQQLLDQSLQIYLPASGKFNQWEKEDHRDSYHILRSTAQLWKTNNITDQYLTYGKVDSKSFKWEIVPYQRCRTWLGRIIQQLTVLWRIVFGGVVVSRENREKQAANYRTFLKAPESIPSEEPSIGTDAFCDGGVIDSQFVFLGKKVNVLYNYAPIGFGGERLHFLVVPNEHREFFTDVVEDEYVEAMELTAKLVTYFMETRKITETAKRAESVYLLNKTGIDAGQTVKHWHLHVICSTNNTQDFWGKLTVVKNILLGSSPMNKTDLEKRVDELTNELSPVFNS